MANAGFNFALLPIAERQAMERHKQECLDRYHRAREIAMEIYSLLNSKGRMWAEREIGKHPELDAAIRSHLNSLIKGKK